MDRAEELAFLDAALDGAQPVVIFAVAGTGGIGKTALAIYWAHRVGDRFPDGHLYLNLRGYDVSASLTSDEALDSMLRAFDIAPENVPAELGAKAGLFRSLLADRRMLIAPPTSARPLRKPLRTECRLAICQRSQAA